MGRPEFRRFTGDDWEWDVTGIAHQADALRRFVYSMRFDPATARYIDFGPVFLNLRLRPEALWKYLGLKRPVAAALLDLNPADTPRLQLQH